MTSGLANYPVRCGLTVANYLRFWPSSFVFPCIDGQVLVGGPVIASRLNDRSDILECPEETIQDARLGSSNTAADTPRRTAS
jgi:hypothetical protein